MSKDELIDAITLVAAVFVLPFVFFLGRRRLAEIKTEIDALEEERARLTKQEEQ